jgi:hypothetical protein
MIYGQFSLRGCFVASSGTRVLAAASSALLPLGLLQPAWLSQQPLRTALA